MKPLELAVRLFDHYETVHEIKHYYGLLALYGLARVAEADDNNEIFERCESILRRFPDEVEHPRYNFPSYTIGGIPQAYLVSLGRMPDRDALVRSYADEMLTAPRDPRGIMKYPHEPEADKIWIDVAMAVSPYLLYAGTELADERYLGEAVAQAVLMYDEFIDPDNGLLHQCKNWVGPGLYSQDHWSRGNGWGYFALAELLPLNQDAVAKRFTALSEALLQHQSDDGLWRQEIPLESSYQESSGSGLILYGIGAGIRHGILDPDFYLPALRRGINGLVRTSVNDDFSIENSCPGTLCPGKGAAKGTVAAYLERTPHRDEPHGCGPLMLALVEASRNGIREVH